MKDIPDLGILIYSGFTLKQIADGEGSFDDINFFGLQIDEEYGDFFGGSSRFTLVNQYNTGSPPTIVIIFNPKPEPVPEPGPECKNTLLGLGILALIYNFLKYSKKD